MACQGALVITPLLKIPIEVANMIWIALSKAEILYQ